MTTTLEDELNDVLDDTTAEDPGITLSAAAAKRMREILSESGRESAVLRVRVDGGGCSGFSYGFALDDGPGEDDIVVERDGIMLVVDEMSAQYMPGAEVDFSDELIGAAFTVNNPIATSGCGCGTSFSI